MSFLSSIFIFAFLPVALIGAYLLPGKCRNIFIMILSALFYFWGGVYDIILILLFVGFDFYTAIMLRVKRDDPEKQKSILAISVLMNVSMLFAYKLFNISKPLGISFIIFSLLSYMFDVYYEKIESINFINFATYIFLFPKMVMGPIVRYREIEHELDNPKKHLGFNELSPGVIRFIIGLSKKLIIADSLALIANRYFLLVEIDRSVSIAGVWLGAVAFSLQLYFDFSGYSDMAIGLGNILGFKFKENFNYPYCAKSIKDFWKRWHISLSSWFSEYIYIPLGGSKEGYAKQIRNLFIIWIFTGLWHGTAWTFVAWGLYYFILLIIEKRFNITKKITLLLVNFGWVFFRAPNIKVAFEYIKHMFGIGVNGIIDHQAIFILKDSWFFLVCAVIFSTPIMRNIKENVEDTKYENIYAVARLIVITALLFVCMTSILTTVYNPFLYMNF